MSSASAVDGRSLPHAKHPAGRPLRHLPIDIHHDRRVPRLEEHHPGVLPVPSRRVELDRRHHRDRRLATRIPRRRSQNPAVDGAARRDSLPRRSRVAFSGVKLTLQPTPCFGLGSPHWAWSGLHAQPGRKWSPSCPFKVLSAWASSALSLDGLPDPSWPRAARV